MDKIVSDKVEQFFSHYTLRKYPKGQILLLNGNAASHVFHLESGAVKQYDVSYRGDEIILNIFKPPAFFPMSLAVNGGESAYVYEAKTPLVLREAPVEDVIRFVKENPDVLLNLLGRVYRGVDGILERMTHLMSSSARERLLFELIIEARRFGDKQSNGSYVLKISEKELGARAGLSRETISREISKLLSEGVIQSVDHNLLVPDLLKIVDKLG